MQPFRAPSRVWGGSARAVESDCVPPRGSESDGVPSWVEAIDRGCDDMLLEPGEPQVPCSKPDLCEIGAARCPAWLLLVSLPSLWSHGLLSEVPRWSVKLCASQNRGSKPEISGLCAASHPA